VSFHVQSPAAAAELQNKMLQYSILQFWKQLGEKVQRDFFDKLKRRARKSADPRSEKFWNGRNIPPAGASNKRNSPGRQIGRDIV